MNSEKPCIYVNEYVGSLHRNPDMVFKIRCLVADGIRSFLNTWYTDYDSSVRVWTCKSYRMAEVKVVNEKNMSEKIEQDIYAELANLYNKALELERDHNKQE
jgi:hypothetical protein